MAPTLGRMTPLNPARQRRHAAARSRTVTALLSAGGFLGIIGSLATSPTAASTSTASTVPPAAPATAPTAPAPLPTADPPTPDNPWTYGGTPARTFDQRPVTRSHASH